MCITQAKMENLKNARPKLTNKLENAASYDIIFLGYPNWWGTVPMPILTFLEGNNFSGKNIVTFATHGGGGLGKGAEDIAATVKQANVIEGIAISDKNVELQTTKDEISNWLKKINL